MIYTVSEQQHTVVIYAAGNEYRLKIPDFSSKRNLRQALFVVQQAASKTNSAVAANLTKANNRIEELENEIKALRAELHVRKELQEALDRLTPEEHGLLVKRFVTSKYKDNDRASLSAKLVAARKLLKQNTLRYLQAELGAHYVDQLAALLAKYDLDDETIDQLLKLRKLFNQGGT